MSTRRGVARARELTSIARDRYVCCIRSFHQVFDYDICVEHDVNPGLTDIYA